MKYFIYSTALLLYIIYISAALLMPKGEVVTNQEMLHEMIRREYSNGN